VQRFIKICMMPRPWTLSIITSMEISVLYLCLQIQKLFYCTRSSQKCISNSCTVLDSILEEERDKVKNLDLDYLATFGKSIRCAVVC